MMANKIIDTAERLTADSNIGLHQGKLKNGCTAVIYIIEGEILIR